MARPRKAKRTKKELIEQAKLLGPPVKLMLETEKDHDVVVEDAQQVYDDTVNPSRELLDETIKDVYEKSLLENGKPEWINTGTSRKPNLIQAQRRQHKAKDVSGNVIYGPDMIVDMIDELDDNSDPVLDGDGQPVKVPRLDGDGQPVKVPRLDGDGQPVKVPRLERVEYLIARPKEEDYTLVVKF